MNLKQLSSVAALLLLAACAQPNLPQQNSWQAAEQVQDFSADGRLAVKVEGKGSYANFDWTYQNAVQTIDVNTPLGNTVGQLCQDSEGVLAVDSKGKVYQAETAEELSRQLLALLCRFNICIFGQMVNALPMRHTKFCLMAVWSSLTGRYRAL